MKKKDPTSHRIIEKRRRDRMNNCLADLSKLIPAHYMKKGRGRVEKTEIIEMAIKHLKDLIKSSAFGGESDHQQAGGSQLDSMGASASSADCLALSPEQIHHNNHLQTTMALRPTMPVDFSMSESKLRTSSASGNDDDEHPAGPMAAIRQQQRDQPPGGPGSNSSSSSSLSTKQFHYQQYHNNERQINERANEQAFGAGNNNSTSTSNKYRSGECCTCRARMISKINVGCGSSSSGGNNNNGSSSDQSDAGSIDYSSSSGGSNMSHEKSSQASSADKSAISSESASESAPDAKGSPTSSTSSHSSACSSSSSASSNSTGWYKKAWLVRSFSRSIGKN